MKKSQLLCGASLLGAATFGAAKVGCSQVLFPIAPPTISLAPADSTPALLAASELTPAQILARGRETSEAQLQALTPKNRDSLDWISGAMWAGIAEFAAVSGRSLETDAVRQMGEKANWTPGNSTKRPFHADDDAIGQAFLADYARRRDAASLAPTRADMDLLVGRLRDTEKVPRPVEWTWCDALFMAPPVMSRLSSLTGDLKYLDAMDKEWWKTAALLYDPEEHLFFRDRGFLKKLEQNGQKVFWSRGNGWVLSGLSRVLTYMPRNYPSRPRYERMFREMSARLVKLQGKDGMWRASLLDPAAYPAPESSGTAFFCSSIAWGINNGLLPRAGYENAARKAWIGLVEHRRADKLPGFVQAVGAAPGAVRAQASHLYATGGFLLAATEMAQLTATRGQLAGMRPTAQLPLSRRPLLSIPASIPAPGADLSKSRAFVRHVPERMDDIAWENNRIAFRTYGPELEKSEKTGSGIDVWAKSTRRLVLGVGDWYAGNYHKNTGEGLDYYHVGQTRGCGGLGVWDGEKLHVSKAWSSFKILESGPNRARFELTYAPWDAGGRKVWETRIITLGADSNLNRLESTLHSDKPGEIVVGIGIAKTVGDAATIDAASGLLASWEAPTPDGIIGCGVLVDPKTVSGTAEDTLNRLILVRAMPEKSLVYFAGAGWNRSGDFANQAEWLDYLRKFAR